MKESFDEHVRKMVLKKISDYRLTRRNFVAGFQKNMSVLEENGPAILKLEMERFLPRPYQQLFQEKYKLMTAEVAKELKEFLTGV